MGSRKSILLSAGLAGVFLWFAFTPVSYAELSIEESKKLLQESLTISEIDRELSRLSAEEVIVGQQIEKTELDIAAQNEKVEKAKVHAGKVLRSYYTGDRNNVWLLLLHADSFSDALSVYRYLQFIAESDNRAMARYKAATRELKQLQLQLAQRQTDLRELKNAFIDQRERFVKLQTELGRKLAEVDNKTALLAQMEQLNNAWRTDGLPVFREFLKAMSDAMLHLEDYLSANDNALEQKNRKSFLFHIKEEPLNQFLRKQNELFETFIYTITEDHIMINGKRDDVEITVKGHFAIEKEPEEALRFLLDELAYNGFVLPDTTKAEMQKQFSMTFYPKRNALTSLLEVTSVELLPGELIIELTLP